MKTIEKAEEHYKAVHQFYKAYLRDKIDTHGLTKLATVLKMDRSQFLNPITKDSLKSLRRVSLLINEAEKKGDFK